MVYVCIQGKKTILIQVPYSINIVFDDNFSGPLSYLSILCTMILLTVVHNKKTAPVTMTSCSTLPLMLSSYIYHRGLRLTRIQTEPQVKPQVNDGPFIVFVRYQVNEWLLYVTNTSFDTI